jgi:acyl carrier protein
MEKLMADLKRQIITQLNLKDLKPGDIGDDQPLFVEGLGLDSIDALELIVLLQQEYKIKLASADEGPAVFQTIRTMARYISARQGAVSAEAQGAAFAEAQGAAQGQSQDAAQGEKTP